MAFLMAGVLTAVMVPLASWGLDSASAGASVHSVASVGQALKLTTVKVPHIGTVVATSSGLTLYRYASDPTGQATCTGVCAKVWPPLLLPKGDTAIKGPRGLKGFSTIHLSSGRSQASFKGAALYRFAGDKKKGQAKGQGVEGTWAALLSNGKLSPAVTAPPVVATPTTTTTPSTTPSTPSTARATPSTTPTVTTPVTMPPPPTSPPATTPTTTPTTQPSAPSPPTTTPTPIGF